MLSTFMPQWLWCRRERARVRTCVVCSLSYVRCSFAVHSPFIHRSFVRPFVRSFVRPFVHSSVHSSIRPFVRSSVRSFVLLFVRSFVRSFACSFVRVMVRYNSGGWTGFVQELWSYAIPEQHAEAEEFVVIAADSRWRRPIKWRKIHTIKGHQFIATFFGQPTFCSLCSDLIWWDLLLYENATYCKWHQHSDVSQTKTSKHKQTHACARPCRGAHLTCTRVHGHNHGRTTPRWTDALTHGRMRMNRSTHSRLYMAL